jgi:prepilin-type N-terminal cleavage/methylation domain-containing protein
MISARHATGMLSRPGFTIIELMISMMIGLIVLGAVYKLMITQTSGYGKQRELADVRETARSGSTLLSRDLRHAASGGGAVVAMSPNSITLRSVRGVGIVCAKHPTLPRYALARTAGKFDAGADDSAMVFQIGRETWRRVKVSGVGTPAAMGVPTCAWPSGPAPDVVIEIPVTTTAIKVGAPLRSFRRVQYTQYSLDGRWWLGRKIGAAVDFEQLTGPLRASSGLSFAYFDTLGAPTALPSAVGMVAFTLNAESYKKARLNSGEYAFQRDSLTTKVLLRR